MPALRSRFMPHALSCLLGLGALSSALAASADPFVDQLAVAGAAEIQASQTVLTKTQFDDTRTLAHRLIDDHTDLNQKLVALASQLHIAMPDAATVQAQAAKMQVAPAKGESVDAAFATEQVKAHEGAVKLFQNEIATATIPELKLFAQTNLAMMEHHLKMANRLLKTHRK
ncbi:DUF4142 domain-containing protein [Pseudomonas sp. dw_358]|uniref:DUF4142 domain-containing protein n=1 Tax=Pseudomonas sp. dw_358 TaxID=2720083 RepID=UPI001BD50913|nr:DUF4142 domain-containing protein [Pseudomonas sp. dw_358]